MTMTDPASGASSFGTGGAQKMDANGGVDLNLPVRAINRSEHPITWQYARVPHVLQPGIPTFVPYEAMVYWQGDPRAIDMPGGRLHEQHRRQQREHLRALYGVYEDETLWANIPLVECYPIDSDLRFETVLLDPEGVALSDTKASANETEFLRGELARVQNQMAHLAAQIQMRDSEQEAFEAAGLDPDERRVTTAKAVAPEQSMVPQSPSRPVRAGVAKTGAKVTKDA